MKQKQLLAALLFCGLFAIKANAQITWAAEVAPILYDHCVNCHRAGGVGSFALETWTDAKTNATAILEAVETRNMPPWRANPAYRHFKNENYLSDNEIQTIAAWVNGGQLPGDLNQAPPLPNFQNGSQLTSVDIQITTPQFTVFSESDIYRAFVIPTDVTQDKFFNEIEILPGNDAIIHHIVLYTDPTNEPVVRDLADPGPGFTTNGMVGNITPQATLIGEWTPGGTPIKLPAQFGYRIPPNGYFIFEIHFAPGHINQTDEGSTINIKLTGNNPRELYYGALVAADNSFGLINPPFKIPANTEHQLIGELKVADLAPLPLSVFSLTPHAHVYGKSFKAYSYRPGFTDTIPLIDIPKWDFYWQSTYTLQKPIKLNTNRRCRAEVWYDNTSNNPNNPNDPPVDVVWGEKTTDEMLYLFATIAIWQAGDENIILDSSLLAVPVVAVPGDGTFSVGPNPFTDILDIRTGAVLKGMSDLSIVDMSGRIQRQWRERDLERARISTASLSPGAYALRIAHEGKVMSYKIVKE